MSFDARPTVRRRMLALLVVAVTMVGGLFALSAPGTAVTDDEAALASLVNGARAAAGLPPLVVSGALSDAARAHSAAMAASGTLYHSSGLAIGDWTATGENVGVGGSVAEIHAALMSSGTHRANILGDFDTLGVGVVRGADGRLWATEAFVKSASPLPAPEPVLEPVLEPVPEPAPVVAPVTPAVDTTVVAAAVVEPVRPKAEPQRRPAKVRTAPARRAAPTRPAAASDSECLPEQAQAHGQAHAYGRCDQVPQGQGQGHGRGRP